MKKIIDPNLYDENIPLIFTDGSLVYNDLKKEYNIHSQGFFIYAPSGVGKTYFINKQIEKDWIDGDLLWSKTFAFPNDDWWNRPGNEIDTIERRADVITEQAKKLGFWIMGASCVSINPDAIVIPPLNIHLKYIINRENNNYDGGLTSENIDRIKSFRKYVLRYKKQGVPCFKSVDEAVHYLSRLNHDKYHQ